MGTKKNRWSEKDIKTMMSMMDKNGFTAETTSAVAKKIKRSTSAVQNKYRALTGKVKKPKSIAKQHYSNNGAGSAIDAAEQAFKASTEGSANTNSTVPEQEVKIEIADHAKGFIEVKDAKLIHYTNNLLILQVGKEVVIYNI